MIKESVSLKKNVLITLSTMGQFPEMYKLAEQLKKSEHFNPIMYFNLSVYGTSVRLAQVCLNNGLDILDYTQGFFQAQKIAVTDVSASSAPNIQAPKQVRSGLVSQFKYLIKTKFPAVFQILKSIVLYVQGSMGLLGFFYRVYEKLSRKKKEKTYIDTLKIKLMIFAEDSEDYHTPQLIRLGRDSQIKSVVFPYTYANQFEFLEDAFFNNRHVNKNFLCWVTGYLFPKWTFDYKGKKILKSAPYLILSAELFKHSPENPWVMNSGSADSIAVESQFMKSYFGAVGIPLEKMIVTGYPSLDHLFEIIQNKASYRIRLSEVSGLDTRKRWVVCAVPPSQWPRAGVGFKTYEQFLQEFINFFRQMTDVEVLFKFHPRIGEAAAQKTCDQLGIKYFSQDTVELIGMSDMYVATVSSTMRWALALGLPTINYDMYDYNYGDFSLAKNYYTVVTFADFKNIYKKLISTENTESVQEDYACLDGRSNERVLKLFSDLTQSNNR